MIVIINIIIVIIAIKGSISYYSSIYKKAVIVTTEVNIIDNSNDIVAAASIVSFLVSEVATVKITVIITCADEAVIIIKIVTCKESPGDPRRAKRAFDSPAQSGLGGATCAQALLARFFQGFIDLFAVVSPVAF